MTPFEMINAQMKMVQDSIMKSGQKKRQTFEDFLQDQYQKSDHATDDPDKGQDWVGNLDVQEVCDYAQEWGNTLV